MKLSGARSCEIPENAFLRRYRERGSYADCYVAEVEGAVSQAAFVHAFYTTTLFKVERLLLKWFASRPSTDQEAKEFAAGSKASFAAWRVEDRDAGQLLVSAGRTRSWFMASPVNGGAGDALVTRLFFGSAVLARPSRKSGKPELGLAFHALLGFHRLYSRALLQAAVSRLRAGRNAVAR
jgi:hypothetical protein